MSNPRVEELEARRLFAVPSGFSETRIGPAIPRTSSMALAPDGRIFVSEQDGDLRVIKNGDLLDEPFVSVAVTGEDSGERGLIGTAFDPNYASNRFVYAYYTTRVDGAVRNRVSRFTASGSNPDRATGGSETVIFETDTLGSSTFHNGGSLHFGPDGKLYISVGENSVGSNAQSLSNVLGKMLRINKDGTIPTDNPFYNQTSGRDRAIWARGFRNPFTFAFQPGTGRMFINDVGSTKFEEINEGVRGANYGWPGTEGPTSNSAFKTPFYSYAHNGGDGAIAGAAFYNPANPTFPRDYLGDYFFGDYGTGVLKRIDTNTKAVSTFNNDAEDIVDVDVAPDGSLYYLLRHKGVFRVTPATSGPPVIAVQPQSRTVADGQNVTFSVTASGNGPFTYQWQRNGSNIGGANGSTFSLNPARDSDDGDAFRVIVSNAAGSVTSSTATLRVLDGSPPTARIVTPTWDALYRGGTTINFSGIASDAEDGTLPASAFRWEVLFHHANHTHPAAGPFTGARSGSFFIPDRGETSDFVWYRIHLTVTDSSGLTRSVFRDVLPRKSQITLATNVPGLDLTLDGAPVDAPLTDRAVVGIKRSIGAPLTQTVGGKVYSFAGWSDGGGRVHDITTPSANTTYTAIYGTPSSVDAYVRGRGSAGRNFGNDRGLLVKRSPEVGNTREAYLRFNIGAFPTVGSAKIRLFGRISDSGSVGVNLFDVANTTWPETGITWNNKPAAGAQRGGATKAFSGTIGRWYEWDVTRYVRQRRIAGATSVSFVLKGAAASDPWVIFNSTEALGDRPALVVKG